MYNVFTNDKKLAQVQELEKMKKKFIQDEPERKKKQEKLSNSYKKRVENFVLQMAEKPLVTHDFVPAVQKIRDEDPSRFLGPSSVIIRSFKHEKDRIKENIENYKNSRMEYTNNPFEFRKREVSREIQPMMRFTSKTNFERVANRLKVLMQNPNHDTRALAKGTENLSDSFILELSKSPQATNKYLAKNLLPELNTKTHFKATHSFFLGLPDTLMDKHLGKPQTENAQKRKENADASPKAHPLKGKYRSSADSFTSDMSPKPGANLPYLRQATTASPKAEGFEERQMKLEKQQTHIETVNPIEVSKKVLIKCNVIKPKKDGVMTLKKGDGHLMSMSERNLKEVYEQVYHKTSVL